MKTIRDNNGNLHKVKSYEELAKIIRTPQQIDICNSKGDRIEKKFFDFTIAGAKVYGVSFC